MDSNTLDTLLIAKRLLLITQQQCQAGERHASTAGLIILQDALELVLLACLAERNISIKERAPFNSLIEAVEKEICPVPNKIKLLGLNKGRVGSKHYGNTVDQYAAKEFFNKTTETIEQLILTTFAKPFYQIFSAELIQHAETKTLLENASQILEKTPKESYLCLVNIRKAIFINFEKDYSIEEWKTVERNKKTSFLDILLFNMKAPFHTRNKEWIEENVNDVFDYIQIDYDRIKSELIEYGISSVDFFNLLRLTPKVFKSKGKNLWKSERNFTFDRIPKEMLHYCLSTAIEAVLMKENYNAQHKSSPEQTGLKIQTSCDTYLYKKASVTSKKIKKVKSGESLSANSLLSGLDDESLFVKIFDINDYPETEIIKGYILNDHVSYSQFN